MNKAVFKKVCFICIILILALLSSVLFGLTDRINREKRSNFLYTDMLHEIQLEILKAHLWQEKQIHGNQSVDFGKIGLAIDDSIRLANAMLLGGTSLHDQDVDAIKNKGMHSQTKVLKFYLLWYRFHSRDGYTRRLQGELVNDFELDQFYERVIAQAATLDDKFEILQAKNEEKTRVLYWSVLLPWIIALIVAVNGLWKRELDRRQAAVLHKARGELEEKVEARTAQFLLANERLSKQYNQQHKINTLLELSVETLSLDQYLDRTLDLLLALPWLQVPAKGAVFLVEDEKDVLVMRVNRGFSDFEQESCRLLKFGTCTCGRAAADKKLIHGPADDRCGDVSHPGQLLSFCYCVPILADDRVLGLINLYLPKNHSRTQEEEEFLAAIAATLAGIIKRKHIEEEAELRRAQVIQADKMASLGLMLSGVTHEINNPNNYILSNAQLVKNIYNDGRAILDKYDQGQTQPWQLGGLPYSEVRDVMPKLLDGIIDGSRRIKNTVEGLKDFARQDSRPLDERLDINRIIMVAFDLVKTQVKKYTDNFHLQLDSKSPLVQGGAQQLEQVMINVMLNAAQALPARHCNIWVSSGYSKQDGLVIVQIKDEGEGIQPSDLKSITRPFFTTKATHGGTGLGLAISDAIIKAHRGKLEFESTWGQGTIVRILLPII